MASVKYSINWTPDGDIISITFHLPDMSLYVRSSDVDMSLDPATGDIVDDAKKALLAFLHVAYAKKKAHLQNVEEQMAAKAMEEMEKQNRPDRLVKLDFTVADITGE